MQQEEKNVKTLETRSHQSLLKILNNIGIIGAILAAVADVIFVIIFVIGVDIHIDMSATILFSCINACIGLIINVLLRYQGIKYAEIENEDLCNKFYEKKVKEIKNPLPIGTWQIIQGLKDFVIKGAITAFMIFGIIYISIEGSKNPIQILMTLVNLVLFACFGLMSMNSSYYRFYNVQIPYMKLKIKEMEEKENGTN